MPRVREHHVHQGSNRSVYNVVATQIVPEDELPEWPPWVIYGIETKGWVASVGEVFDTSGWIPGQGPAAPNWKDVAERLREALSDQTLGELLDTDGFDSEPLTAAIDMYEVASMQQAEFEAALPPRLGGDDQERGD